MKITIQEMTRVAFFSALICIASFILKFGGEVVVPFSILPLMILLTGALLGSRLGALSVTVYVLLGLIGVPVFAQPPYGGLTYIFQPSFGFLPGFILAAYTVGKLVEKVPSPHLGRILGAMLAGIVVLYFIGIPYLYGIIKLYFGKPFTLWKAVEIGLLPFIGMDLCKGLLAGVVAHGVLKRLVRSGSVNR